MRSRRRLPRRRNSGVRSCRSCRSCRIREQGLYPKNPGPASPWENLRQAPKFSSLNFSQVSQLVRSSPVASCLGSSLQGRKPSRLAPTDVGTPCALLTGREKCGLAPELLQLLTSEFRNVGTGRAKLPV